MKTIGLILCLLALIALTRAQQLPIPANRNQTFDIGKQEFQYWWYGAAVQAVRINSTGGPLIPTRTFAILAVAIHNTVNAFNPVYEFYGTGLNPPFGADIDAAVAGAGFQSLLLLYPNRIPDWTIIYRTQLALLKRITNFRNHTNIRFGFRFGRTVAAGVYALRANDGAFQDLFVPYTFTGAQGEFRPTPPLLATPLGTRWGFLTPWTLQTNTQFRPPGPPFGTPLYEPQYRELLGKGVTPNLGIPVTRTPLETYAALFFAVELTGQSTPPGQYIETAYLIALDNKLTRAECARFIALTAIAQADAAITAWDAKYFYRHWRPVTAIVNNTNTSLPTISNWFPLLEVTPPFPDYVSGHSTFGGAVTTIWQNWFQTDNFRYRVYSDSLPGVTAIYNSFSQYQTDNAYSRIWAGVHFRKSCQDGVASGIGIGNYVWTNFLRPVS